MSAAFGPKRAGQLWKADGDGRHSSGAAPAPGRDATVLDRLLSSLALSPEQEHRLQEASGRLLHALMRCPADAPIGRLLAAQQQPLPHSHDAHGAPADALGEARRQDVTLAALLLPPITWQWLSVADLDGWVDRGAAHLLREALIVQRAAADTSTSVSELVGWCLDTCSRPAAALAALWGQQQGQSLPPRVRSFYGLMLQRLGHTAAAGSCGPHDAAAPAAPRNAVPRVGGDGAAAPAAACGAAAGGGGGVSRAWLATAGCAVMCGSVTRTAALPASPRRQALQAATVEEAQAAGRQGGDGDGSGIGGGADVVGGGATLDGGGGAVGEGNGGAAGQPADPDLVLIRELPPEAHAELSRAAALGRQDNPPAANGSFGGRTSNGKGDDGSMRAAGGSRVEAKYVVGGSGPGGSHGAAASTLLLGSGAGANGAAASRGGASAPPEPVGVGALSGAGVAGPEALPRPVASLLQRPTRGVAVPEAGPGEASKAGGAADGGPAGDGSGSGGGAQRTMRHFVQGGEVQPLPYVPVRLVATGRYPLRDVDHSLLREGVAVPEFGPIVISNDPRVFPGTEALLTDFATRAGEKLAIRLEYVVDRSSYDGRVALQLFNISRTVRKRTDNCRMFVNGKPVQVGDPGVELAPGDEVCFGNRAFAFRVEALPAPPSAVRGALGRFAHRIPRERAAASGSDVAGAAAADAAAQEAVPPSPEGREAPSAREEAPAPSGAVAAAAGDAAGGGEAAMMAAAAAVGGESGSAAAQPPPLAPVAGQVGMAELSVLSRRDPARAEFLLRQQAAAQPGNAAVWLVWAQLAAQLAARGVGGVGTPAKARALFRAAAEAALQMQDVPPPPAALQDLARKAGAARNRRRGRLYGRASGTDDDEYDDGGAGGAFEALDTVGGGSAAAAAGPGSPAAAAATPRRRHNWLLVQALGNWAKHEWRLRMYGSARHLFRAAVDEASRHPYGVAGGGGAAIMHYWASRELDRLNLRNARIVAAEALRKCPGDVALYVLAASVEFEAGNLDLAKSYCGRAYSLDRTDKQLLMLWPRVEAALGDRLKARLLFERAMDAHPLNTKIINLYARFEAEEGAYREAAELFDRALRIDSASPVMGMHNRADWASLEADLGNTQLARRLLEGGLDLHPHAPPLLLTLAKVERLEGRYSEALALVRRAQAVAGPFNEAAIGERAAVLRALGEREMAANLSRHLAAVRQLHRMKQQGYWGSEAWRAYVDATRSGEQRALVAAARSRRRELGWDPAGRDAKPAPTGAAGDGRRPTAPEVQQWMQLQGLRRQRSEARRRAAERAERLRAEEEGEGAAARSGEVSVGVGAAARGGSMSSGDEEFADDDAYEEPPVGVPLLDSVRRPSPGYDEGY